MLFLLLGCVAPEKIGPDTSAVSDSGATDSDTDDTDPTGELYGVPPDAPVPLPTFTAHNQYGEARSEADLVGHPSVLWFYPAAGTYG